MEEQFVFVGDLLPPYTDTLVDANGNPINLTGATVRFRMRAVGSSTNKVDAAATITDAPNGKASYTWVGTDTDTAGLFLVWWVVTIGGSTENVAEKLFEVRAHGQAPPIYVDPEELKNTLDAEGTTYLDDALLRACIAASRGVDLATNRRFWLDPDATSVRTYTPRNLRLLIIDDLVALTSLKVDRTGDTVYEETWAQGTDFILEPQNAPVENPQRPWEWITTRRLRGKWFPVLVEQSVQITGQFGWKKVPEEIKLCTTIVASKLLQRVREAPFGVIAVGGPETGIAERIARTDPDVTPILEAYSRTVPWL